MRFDQWLINATASQIGAAAGLAPAIHLFAKKMDPRVKPAGDA
jgi:hypothetical protein